MTFGVDIEPTNRCNAKCYFCPRDATPHQGLMTPEVFEQALGRCDELRTQAARARPSGAQDEPVRAGRTAPQPRHADVRPEGARGGLRLHDVEQRRAARRARAHALLEAGLQRIAINVGDRDADYEDVYKLPFERTRDNVLRFKELAGDACEVIIVLVDHRRDRAHLESMRQYWGDFGMRAFMEYEIMNRGGALFVDHMQFEEYPQLAEARQLLAGRGVEAVCPTPFAYLFIGFDGQYYLCCSDWKKEVPLGSVADTSFSDVMVAKLAHARSRQPVCKTCNLDPLNKLTEALRRAMPESPTHPTSTR